MKILSAVEDKIFGEAIAQFIGQSNWPESSEIRVVHVMEPLHVDALSGSGSVTVPPRTFLHKSA